MLKLAANDGDYASNVIDTLYDAAGDAALWDQALIRVADAMGCTSSVFVGHGEGSLNAPRFAHFGRFDAEYNLRRTNSNCPYLQPLGTLRPGTIVSAEDTMPLAHRRASDWHQEVAVAQEFEHCLMTVVDKGRGVFGVFFVGRSAKSGDFTGGERDGFAQIVPHLRRAAQLYGRLDAYGALARQRRGMLDHMDTGIVLIDEIGEARCANRAAETAIAQQQYLRLSGARLTAIDGGAKARLDGLIAATMAGGVGGTLAIPRSDESGRPCVVRVCPLRGSIRETLPARGHQTVAVFINSPESHFGELDESLVELYRLTPAEVRVADVLAAGHGISGAAGRLGLSENTVKMHAKRAYEKLGVAGQVQLSQLYGRLSAPARFVDDSLAA
jgi:DNA-binding CsgD family transcriptional regulator